MEGSKIDSRKGYFLQGHRTEQTTGNKISRESFINSGYISKVGI